jgi:hypothetical protein
MSRTLSTLSLLLLSIVAAVAAHKTQSLPCGVGPLDFSALAAGDEISSTDFEALNFYWQPCGVLEGSDTPCANHSFRHSSMCQVNTFTDVAVSVGDWTPRVNVSWALIDQRRSPKQSPDMLTGATLSFHSSQATCNRTNTSAAKYDKALATAAVSRITVTLLCDLSDVYAVHGPLALLNSPDPCDLHMKMRTKLACVV